jgi:hypothetical protein
MEAGECSDYECPSLATLLLEREPDVDVLVPFPSGVYPAKAFVLGFISVVSGPIFTTPNGTETPGNVSPEFAPVPSGPAVPMKGFT